MCVGYTFLFPSSWRSWELGVFTQCFLSVSGSRALVRAWPEFFSWAPCGWCQVCLGCWSLLVAFRFLAKAVSPGIVKLPSLWNKDQGFYSAIVLVSPLGIWHTVRSAKCEAPMSSSVFSLFQGVMQLAFQVCYRLKTLLMNTAWYCQSGSRKEKVPFWKESIVLSFLL